MRRRPHFEHLPRRELLRAVVHDCHQLQNEHERHAEGAIRRRIESRLVDVRERFCRLLEEWVPDDELSRAWRDHLHYRAPEPDGPPPIEPLVFSGRSEAGSVADVREHANGELHVIIDGSPAERVPEATLVAGSRFALIHPNRLPFVETFSASAHALDELAAYVEGDGSPPWDAASELLADGLIDVHFALTPRGRRALVVHAG
jgi:hypothetical protein